MITRSILNSWGLTFRTKAPVHIYLRDHNKHINPSTSILNVSYRNPRNLVPDAPVHQFVQYQLDQELQQLIDRQTFEEYKNKVLRGIVDQEQVQEADPLWGEGPAPSHYYQQLSKVDLMQVSHPHNNDVEPYLQASFLLFFEANHTQEVTRGDVENRSSDVHKLVQLSIAARHQGVQDGEVWFQIENSLGRGKKLYLLSPEELIRLKWAFDNKTKHGSPAFHQILADLLREDIPKLSKEALMSLFYASRYSNPGKINLQLQALEALRPMFKSLSLEEKSKLLLAFTICTKRIKYHGKTHKRRQNEFKERAGSLLLELDLWELPLTHEITSSLVFSLAKLHLENTRFITYPLRDHIVEHIQDYCQDRDRLFQAIVYLGQLEGGQGLMDKELGRLLKEQAERRWGEFREVERMRMIHALWNIGLLDESLMELYRGVEFEADTSLLYYACQIELSNSSEREWQIIQLLAEIEVLPLPYFTAYQRFYNYIKATTDWNLTPLTDKLRNTQYYYSAMRQYDSLSRNSRSYRRLRQFEKFAGVTFMQKGAPIANLELAHFGFPLHRVSLDIIGKKQYVPGSQEIKQSYMNKQVSLRNIGWKHLAFSEDQLRTEELGQIVANIQACFTPYVEEQQAIIDYEDYQKGRQIAIHKHIHQMRNWELDDINRYMAEVTGEEFIELGDVEPELDPEAPEEVKKKEEAGKGGKKKKK